jgi:hypothetical protein
MPQRNPQRIAEMIAEFNRIHDNFYNYSKVVFAVGYDAKIIIICPRHGEFEKWPSNHFAGQGCKLCRKPALKRLQKFIVDSRTTHGSRYDYTFVELTTLQDKVWIGCPEHGLFLQEAGIHKLGRGCQQCVGQRWYTAESYIHKANLVHNNKYSYEKLAYVNNVTRVNVTCPDHGDFHPLPPNHMQGQGCPDCRITFYQQDMWLDSLQLPADRWHRQVRLPVTGGFIIADGYNKETNTVYEFWGDFWHGNPKTTQHTDYHPKAQVTYGELYARTLRKRERIFAAGYKLEEIWSSDWDQVRRRAIKNISSLPIIWTHNRG